MNSTTVATFLKDNNQPLYGLERTGEVNLYVLFYQNLIITSLFDFKATNISSARMDALSFMYWGIGRLLIYLGYSFSPISAHQKRIFNYFENIHEIEKRFSKVIENTNKWLLGSSDYNTIEVGAALTEALLYMNNLLLLSDVTLEQVLYRALEIFGKQWKLPEGKVDEEIRRLDKIRKKSLDTANEEGQQTNKDLSRILNMSKSKPKKIFTAGTRLVRNTRGMRGSSNINGRQKRK